MINTSQAFATPNIKASSKPIKRLLTAIRYQKDELALSSFDGQAQGQLIFGDVWTQKSDEERQRFVNTLHAFFTVVAFPKIRKKYFAHLETILYGDPDTHEDGSVRLRATIVVLHALKKDEIPVDFILRPAQDKWRIVDFAIAPDKDKPSSFIVDLRERQMKPLLEKKGWDGLIETMENRVAELKKKQK
jgi:phospholipid transport system substrate-binding protein